MSEDEIAQAMFEIEELEGGAKRRMMGNVRFIGELCKKGIIKTNIMHNCISDLVCRPAIDEQMLELVCKLLRTVGQQLESTANSEQLIAFDSYFTKLAALASDKRVNSRVRFSMDEIISLRRNNWQERRQTDGPALLEEIRMKAANEEQVKRMQQQGGGRGRGGRGGGPQHSQHEPRGAPLTRNISAGPVKTASGPHAQYGGAEIRRFSSDPTASAAAHESNIDSRQFGSGSSPPSRMIEQDDMDPQLAARKARQIIEEYLHERNAREAIECLSELPLSVRGEFVVVFMDKYLNSHKEDIKSSLSNLLQVVMPQLQAGQVHVETSLGKCEAVLYLVDTIVDIKNVRALYESFYYHSVVTIYLQAPEMLGSIVGSLIRGGACRPQVIDQILSDVRRDNSADELGSPDELVADVHRRFRSTFS